VTAFASSRISKGSSLFDTATPSEMSEIRIERVRAESAPTADSGGDSRGPNEIVLVGSARVIEVRSLGNPEIGAEPLG
jgi:hypothetical protein